MRLAIDLLIKNSVQLKVLQDLMIMTLGAIARPEDRDTLIQGISSSLVKNHEIAKDVLLTEIYKQYGHIDIEGL